MLAARVGNNFNEVGKFGVTLEIEVEEFEELGKGHSLVRTVEEIPLYAHLVVDLHVVLSHLLEHRPRQ